MRDSSWPDELTRHEKESIEDYIAFAAQEGYLSGRVLDIGAGQQPYRAIVERSGGEYVPYDSPSFPASMARTDTTAMAFHETFDTVLCTQVVQYVTDIARFLLNLRGRFHTPQQLGGPQPDGFLVMTYPTNWPEVQEDDHVRYTKAGMQRVLFDAGFKVLDHQRRAQWNLGEGYALAYGYGVIAQRV